MLKNCPKCKTEKPLAEFSKSASRIDGLQSHCKACRAASRRAYWQSPDGRATKRAYDKAYRQSEAGKAVAKIIKDAWKSKNPEKVRAHHAVHKAVIARKLIRQPCFTCGSTAGVDAHHEDYSKPLDVRWLCRVHHLAAHGKASGANQ